MSQAKLTLDIWSDVVCPFCYIGKRRLEAALAAFPHRDQVGVVWHSYQLFPGYVPQAGADFYETVARLKGQTREWSVRFHRQLAEHARTVGLTYNFESIPFPNTFDAHRFSAYARTQGVQPAAEEKLFYAYFTAGQNISDYAVLGQLGEEIGLRKADVLAVLASDQFAQAVRQDLAEAEQLRVSGVPYFLVNGQLAVAGAQDPASFLVLLNQAWQQAASQLAPLPATGAMCDIAGNCA